jgi:phosphohistidine phosphatase
LTKKGRKNIDTIGSYLKLRGIRPDTILASCARRTEETADLLAKKLEYDGPVNYMQELYFTDTDTLKQIIMLQENDADTIFVVGHNPQVTDMANALIDEHISKIPTMGVVAIEFDIGRWSEIEHMKGKMDFFIYPKQFQYYVPNQIRAILSKEV